MVFDKGKKNRRDSNKKTQAFKGVEQVREATRENAWEMESPKRQERVPLYTSHEAKNPKQEREEAYEQYLALRREAKNEVPDEVAPPKKRKKKKKKKSVLRVILIILLLVIILAGAALLYVMNVLGKVGKVEIDQTNLGINPQVEQNLKNYRNIAVLGVDTRDMDNFEGSRTDAIIIVSLDKESKQIRQVSVFRDTYLRMDEKHGFDKVTNVHAYVGTQGTLRTLNENMDLNIREVGLVNWKSVADLIDGLGGIEVNVKKSEIKEMNKYIRDTQRNIGGSKEKIKKPGKQTLNGNQAVTYARIRKDSAKGDYRRNERMKVVLTQTMAKAKTLNPFQLNRLADEVLPEIKTNMTTKDMMAVLWNLATFDSGKQGGWPFDVAGWTYYGVWYGPPVTLKSNVSELHEKYFVAPSYKPTKTVREISEEISRRSGYY